MLRELPNTYLEHILLLYQKCWEEGTLPDEWRQAIVTPIPKKGKPRAELGSYRPISLTSHLGKVYERIIKSRLEHFCDKQNVLPVSQAGFRKGRSVTDHLVTYSSHIRKALSRRRVLLSCFFDIKRAYDTVWHHRLLEKVQRLGIAGRMYQFIKQFLSRRTMQVRWRGALSTVKELQMGVPQGSVIAPLLFSIMLHDVTKAKVDGCELNLYADDLAIWRTTNVRRPRNFEQRNSRGMKEMGLFQRQVDSIAVYLRENGFSLSAEKTQFMVVTRWPTIPTVLQISVNGTIIQHSKTIKYLGVTFDRKGLNVKHVRNNIASARKAVNLIKVLSHFPWANHPKTMVTLVQSLVRSRLLYGLETAFDPSPSLLKDLEITECKALKVGLGLPRATPKALVYREAGLLPIKYVLQFICAKYTFRAQTVPNSIGPELQQSNPQRGGVKGLLSIGDFTRDLKVSAQVDGIQVATRPKHPYPPWELQRPQVFLGMAGIRKNDNPNVIQTVAREFVATHLRNTLRVYTDGSADDKGAGAAFCIPTLRIRRRFHLPRLNIFSVELIAILMALNYILEEVHDLPCSVTVLSDSMSALAALDRDGKSSREDVVIETLSVAHRLIIRGCTVQLQWVPAHVGLAGNELADKEAKQAAANINSTHIDMTLALSDISSKLSGAVWRCWAEDFASGEDCFGAVDPGPPAREGIVLRSVPTHLARFIHRMRCGVWRTIFIHKPCKCGGMISPRHIMLVCPQYADHFKSLTDKLATLALPKELPSIFTPASHGWDLAVLAAKLAYQCDVASFL